MAVEIASHKYETAQISSGRYSVLLDTNNSVNAVVIVQRPAMHSASSDERMNMPIAEFRCLYTLMGEMLDAMTKAGL